MTDDIKKIYWNISEASEIIGVTTPVLRLWDDLYGAYIGKVKRMGTQNQRHYTEGQIEKLKNIKYLLHGDKIDILRKLDNYKKCIEINDLDVVSKFEFKSSKTIKARLKNNHETKKK